MKLLLLLGLVSFGAHAKVQSFVLEGGKKVSVDVKENWEAAKDLFGVPLTVLGPWANESRPVVTIVPTKLTKSDISEEQFKKTFENFKKEKDEWVRSQSQVSNSGKIFWAITSVQNSRSTTFTSSREAITFTVEVKFSISNTQ
jgi:hypothetical protein